ncbi:MAG: diaminopimelate epimerase [Dehalococcoidales bacterium]|nr:diaminopimelate epimerase [Dehalococcoidales bacterium]
MHFTKMQGAGNDFILIKASTDNHDWPRIARAMCHRHFGVGADGLLVLLPSHQASLRMREFNPDGSEAEACGNGLRCLVKYAVDKEVVGPEAEEISVETAVGVNKARVNRVNGKLAGIQIGMGRPRLKAPEIPVLLEADKVNLLDIILSDMVDIAGRRLVLYFVSMGNPHAIHFSRDPVSDFPLSLIGPKIEHHLMFPNRVNFEIANVTGRNRIVARVWERGVGETLACGTGACAVAVASQLLGYTDSSVAVSLPGGTLHVEWDREGEVFLSGPAEEVFSGEWPE